MAEDCIDGLKRVVRHACVLAGDVPVWVWVWCGSSGGWWWWCKVDSGGFIDGFILFLSPGGMGQQVHTEHELAPQSTAKKISHVQGPNALGRAVFGGGWREKMPK